MNKQFEKDRRRKQEIRGRPIADRIYRSIFGDSIGIERFELDDSYVLDKYFAIDVRITLPNDQILLGQEKFLSHKYARYRSMTVEYMDDPAINKQGDWFKLGAQFYFTGYFNEKGDDFEPWVMANWTNIVTETVDGNIRWSHNENKNGRARANFTYTYMEQLPDTSIIACSWKDNPDEEEQISLW
jgi:hypothetical protein